MKLLSLTVIGAVAFAGGANAAPVVQDLSTWVTVADPELEATSAGVTKTSASITYTGNGYEGAVAPTAVTGDWVLTGSMRATSDNDTMGLLLGYDDGANNVRIGWEGGGDWDLETSPQSNGLYIVEETNGVATNIFEDATNFWLIGTTYDFTMSSLSGLLSFEILDGTNVVGSGSATPARGTDGLLGVFVGSNSAVFSNISLDTMPGGPVQAVPLPASLPILGAGLLALAGLRRHRQRA